MVDAVEAALHRNEARNMDATVINGIGCLGFSGPLALVDAR